MYASRTSAIQKSLTAVCCAPPKAAPAPTHVLKAADHVRLIVLEGLVGGHPVAAVDDGPRLLVKADWVHVVRARVLGTGRAHHGMWADLAAPLQGGFEPLGSLQAKQGTYEDGSMWFVAS